MPVESTATDWVLKRFYGWGRMRVLASFGTATARLAGMIKMQTLLLDNPKDEFTQDFDQAMEAVWAEINAAEEKRIEAGEE